MPRSVRLPIRFPAPRTALPGLSLVLFLPLMGCEAALGPFAAVNVVTLTTTGRDAAGLVASAVTGLDCSVAHLDRGEARYCRREPPPPAPTPYCTRSLGAVDCWTGPPPAGMPPARQVADTPPVPVPPPSRGWLLDRLY